MPRNRLFIEEIVSVGAVPDGDNPESEIVFFKKLEKRDVPTEERERLATRGQALPDGSFPIATIADLRNAIKAYGRAKNKAAARRHIIKRARALGATNLLPDMWTKSRQTVKPMEGDRMAEFDFDGFSDEQRTAVEAAFAEFEETIATLEQPEDVEPVDVAKDASPALQELIAKKNEELLAKDAELAKANAELARQRQEARDSEFLAKAADLKAVLGDPETWGPVLDRLEAGAPEEFQALVAQLSVTKAAVETGAIFDELGKSNDAGDKLTVLAKAKMELNPSLTVEAARAQVYLENPDLVEEARSY